MGGGLLLEISHISPFSPIFSIFPIFLYLCGWLANAAAANADACLSANRIRLHWFAPPRGTQ